MLTAGDTGRLDEALERADARLVVLDPIMSFLDSSVICASDQSVRRALAPLLRLAEKHRCALLMQRHLNKQGGGRALYRGLGSIGFVAFCRFAMLVARDPLTPGQCVLAQVRNSLAPLQPSLAYRLSSSDGNPPTVEWLGTSPVSADDLLGGAPRPQRRPGDRAIDFLLQFLAGGPRSARAIWQAAQKAGLSARTLQRAKRRLGIRCRRIHENGQPVRYWLLRDQELPGGFTGDPELDRYFAEMEKKFPPPTPLDEDDGERDLD